MHNRCKTVQCACAADLEARIDCGGNKQQVRRVGALLNFGLQQRTGVGLADTAHFDLKERKQR